MTQTPDERRASKAEYMRAQRALNPEKHRALSNGFTARHRERLNAERNAHYAKNKAEIRAHRYKTTTAVIAALHVIQAGRCAVCEKTLAPWPSNATHVDHCHDTGRVRGLLCRSCNMKEGWVRRYGDRLAKYLATPPGVTAADAQELA